MDGLDGTVRVRPAEHVFGDPVVDGVGYELAAVAVMDAQSVQLRCGRVHSVSVILVGHVIVSHVRAPQ
jgi:hypothetical protein